MPLKKFIACLCDNDLKQLIISGDPSIEEIAEAWAALFYQYCDLVENAEVTYRTRLITEIAVEKRKLEFVTAWLKLLQVTHLPQVAQAIIYVGYDYELNPEDPAQYKADLARISAEVSAARLQLRIKEAEYEAILQNQSTIDSVDEKYFRTLIFNINRYTRANPPITMQSTVADYCVALKAFVDERESKSKTAD